ncbi:MAG: cytochrome c3 family protein [Phycisphaerae bacterium]|jgi:predicted CXXCH cytochrome family protein
MMRVVVATMLSLMLLGVAGADDSVVRSKHDLSIWGPGPVRALEETQVCIFCHTPHNADPAAPLWNRHQPTTYYRIYRSDTTDARIGQPGPASRLCLSCHDGSIALGLTLDRAATEPIPLTHPYMPSGPSDLTNDLSDDHPVGLRYDRALCNRDRQLRSPELVDHRLKLGRWGELECTACHDPHNNELGDFLRVTSREGALCNTCHDMDGWSASAHARSVRSVPPSATNGEALPYRSLADNACAACHVSHSAPWRPRLLRDRPDRLCLNCHDGLSATDIMPVLNLRSGHRLSHVLNPERSPARGLRPSVMVTCADCHNPHAVNATLGDTATRVGVVGPLVPPAMKDVPGVSLTGAPLSAARFYYEVCFRCHADRPVYVPERIVRQRDTDGNVRRQFLPTTASAHPVAFPRRLGADVPSLTPEVQARRFVSCQDCHNNPDARSAGGTLVNGPHGSRYAYLLADRYETSDYTVESPQAYALCYGCHDRASILGDESFPLHREHVVRGRTPCSACHTAHGVSGSTGNHGHLINFDLSIVGGRRGYVDTGQRRGSCTLNCHGVNHVNFTYEP